MLVVAFFLGGGLRLGGDRFGKLRVLGGGLGFEGIGLKGAAGLFMERPCAKDTCTNYRITGQQPNGIWAAPMWAVETGGPFKWEESKDPVGPRAGRRFAGLQGWGSALEVQEPRT